MWATHFVIIEIMTKFASCKNNKNFLKKEKKGLFINVII